jgi:phosphohistidine phosphatase
MLQLLLLRHAKSNRDDSACADHERGLAPRGELAAARIGALMEKERMVPDMVLCSTARRAEATVRIASSRWSNQPTVRYLSTVYLAPPSRLLAIIRRQPRSIARLMLVGHNPGLHHLALLLSDGKESHLRTRLAEKLPTAGLVQLGFSATAWSEIGPGQGNLLGFYRPRDLG